jgi:hypothetical protein
MESLFRPGNPTILCFDGAADGASYGRVKLNNLTIVHPKSARFYRRALLFCL